MRIEHGINVVEEGVFIGNRYVWLGQKSKMLYNDFK
jgi:hypothetical protein